MDQTQMMSKEEFNQLPLKEQRVLIAKDVIAQLKANRYEAVTGEYIQDLYLDSGPLDFRYSTSDRAELDIKDNFGKIKQCNVCALGACLLSTTRFKNELKFKDLKDVTNSMCRTTTSKDETLLLSIFSEEQLALIEIFFEGDNHAYTFGVPVDSDAEEAAKRFESYFSKEDRMYNIMQNIVDNGELVWEKLRDLVPADYIVEEDDWDD